MKRFFFALFALCMLVSFPLDTNAASTKGLKTVVIDAGHGGKDPGAVSADKKTYEKSLALDIAQKLADKIRTSYPDVKVVLTRKDDNFVELDRRAKIANKEDADLFISIHINASVNKGPNGYSVHVLGESSKKNRDLFAANMDIVRRENAVITLEGDDFSEKYSGFDPKDPESFIFMQFMQNTYLEQSIQFAQICAQKLGASPLRTNNGVSQNPFLVLWKTSMPAVLVELGYISNADDLWTLRQATNREKISECLFQAFKTYKSQYDASVAPTSKKKVEENKPEVKKEEPKAEPKIEAKAEPKAEPKADAKPAVASSGVKYGVQVFAVGSKLANSDSRFMGYKTVISVKAGNVYKYIIGVSSDEAGARKNLANIKKKYPDAFLVKVTGETVERLR